MRFATVRGRRLIQLGLATMAVGTGALIAVLTTAGPELSVWRVAGPVFVIGLGMGLCVSIITAVVLADVPVDSAGAGPGVTNAVLQLGTAAGIAIVGTVMFGLAADGAPAAGAATLGYNVLASLLALGLTPRLPRAARGDDPVAPAPPEDGAASPLNRAA